MTSSRWEAVPTSLRDPYVPARPMFKAGFAISANLFFGICSNGTPRGAKIVDVTGQVPLAALAFVTLWMANVLAKPMSMGIVLVTSAKTDFLPFRPIMDWDAHIVNAMLEAHK